jgi:hypothetical protein
MLQSPGSQKPVSFVLLFGSTVSPPGLNKAGPADEEETSAAVLELRLADGESRTGSTETTVFSEKSIETLSSLLVLSSGRPPCVTSCGGQLDDTWRKYGRARRKAKRSMVFPNEYED